MPDFIPGLEGVVAFETEIAEPDKEGGSLRYRGVDIEELVGHVTYGHVWGPAGENPVPPRPPAGRAVPDPGALRGHQGGRAERAGHAGPGLRNAPANGHQRRAGQGRPGPGLGDGAVLRRAGTPRPGPADDLAAAGQRGEDDHRAVHDPLAR